MTEHTQKKIAYLANIRFPSERAHASQIAHMCQAFSECGVETHLFVNKRRTDASKSVNEWMGLEPHFSITHIPPKFFFPRIRFTFYLGEFVFALYFLLSAGHKQFSHLYCRGEWILYFLSFVVPAQKLVWESHEARLSVPARKLLKRGVRTVVISEGIYDDYVSAGVSPEQLLVAHDGIDESFSGAVESQSVARERLGIKSEKPVVMYIGGFDAWKGIDTFCKAATSAPELQFVVIGGRQEEVAQKSKQYQSVQFIGSLPYKDLKHNQQAADVLVVPNTAKIDLSSKHTSPLKLFAHMASGVPLVVTDVPSLTSVVQAPLVTICAPDDPSAMAAAVREVCDQRSEKHRQAIKLREAAKQYTWTERARLISDFMNGG